MNNEVLKCVGVTKSYRDGEKDVEVLQGINLTINQGEMVAVLGSSGSGKSTLLHILGTLDKASTGTVAIKGTDVGRLNRSETAEFRNQHLGFIYQFHHLLMEFTALENVAMPLLIAGIKPTQARTFATELLEAVGLAHRIQHRPSALSGGERQRVAIARALVVKPSLVLADEPTGNLDKQNGELVFNLLRKLNQTLKTSFVIVTHDLDLAAKMDRIVKLDEGKLVELKAQSVC
ncbi:Lipoprotein releasing system ATP-binding protein LolD [Pseudoalteromonas luteoviolacea B = ATCC 29581]|nr:Lipoprotein releasing system ATP-binding protein LolD [Pseudoalteromonas luteoviolacea B = ATCC 29581]